jgi:hypothetical protein
MTKTVHYSLRRREEMGIKVVPRRTGNPDLYWGAFFIHLLRTALGKIPFMNELIMEDLTTTDGSECSECVVIRSHSPTRGTTTGDLWIRVDHNHPSSGYSTILDSDSVDDWSLLQCKSTRKPRILVRPCDEFFLDHFIEVLPPLPNQPHSIHTSNLHSQRFRGDVFARWNHAVIEVCTPVWCMDVYHDDFNCSELPVLIVKRCIEEHYRRAAGGAPHSSHRPRLRRAGAAAADDGAAVGLVP